jgi:hypothetical protein
MRSYLSIPFHRRRLTFSARSGVGNFATVKLTCCAIAFAAFAHPVAGQTNPECRLQPDSSARLACYDAIYPPPPDDSSSLNRTTTKPTFDYSWAGVPTCRSLSSSPAFAFSNFSPNTKRVSMLLTQGERELGGEEVPFPANGVIPAAAIIMMGPCVPGTYRWTATLKSAAGETLAIVREDRNFPGE